MATSGTQPTAPVYLSAAQLYVGAFVILDLPWFKHSFTLNSFKVRNEDQVTELRALRLERYQYDPERSDPPPLPLTDLPVAVAAPQADEAPAIPANPQQALQLQRQQLVRQRRENVEKVEKAFSKATAVMKSLNKNIFSRPKETLEEMGALVGDMVDAFLNAPEATLHVMGEKAGGEDVYFHSLNVAILAMMLAKELEFTQAQAREMSIGALLHDIGLTEIPDRVVKKPTSEASKAERNFRATHVEIGVEIARKAGLSAQALAVVAQHHELADGSGYPKGLKMEAMTPAARLISLINYYDNLCNPSDIAKALTPHEALSYMFSQGRPKFEPRALQLLIRSLGVHPPGSIVQLSDDSFAVVTSVNPKKPLRPWVLVYDESVPKDEAIMMNLEDQPDLRIVKSIRPSLLSPKVASYLNPRKRVTYFFDGSSADTGPGAL